VTAPRIWTDLRRFTPARVGLGRVGNAQPTSAHLAFAADHAAARDAVMAELDTQALRTALGPAQIVHSAAPDRQSYLLRPDLGRRLAPDTHLTPNPGCLAIVIADGLSAIAAQRHAAALVKALGLPAELIIATQARVAIGDPIGAALQAEAVLVLIGERPGLTSADSLGAYLTWAPRPGRTDAERNCVSNIRPDGLPIAEAAAKLRWLLTQARTLQLTGVALKDEAPSPPAQAYDRSISVD
jgi:ethanolamine ammonia-lyase small subunit